MTTQKRTRPAKRTTMRDVAKRAKVSQSTVSRVLRPTPQAIPIGEETRQRVLNAVEELGYYPNLHDGRLRGQKTHLIAMMIADIANPFYHPMVRAVQDVAHLHRYDVLVANSDHLRENELLFCESIIYRPVDGIILGPYYLTDEALEQLWVQTGAALRFWAARLSKGSQRPGWRDDNYLRKGCSNCCTQQACSSESLGGGGASW